MRCRTGVPMADIGSRPLGQPQRTHPIHTNRATNPNGNWERKAGVRRAPLANNGRQPCSHPHMECTHIASTGGVHRGKSVDVGALRCTLRAHKRRTQQHSTRRTGANNGKGGTPRRRTQQRHPATPGELPQWTPRKAPEHNLERMYAMVRPRSLLGAAQS